VAQILYQERYNSSCKQSLIKLTTTSNWTERNKFMKIGKEYYNTQLHTHTQKEAFQKSIPRSQYTDL